MAGKCRALIIWAAFVWIVGLGGEALTAPVPDTGQIKCYDDTAEIACPRPGED